MTNFALNVEKESNRFHGQNRWSEIRLWLQYFFIEWFIDDVIEKVNSESAHTPIDGAVKSGLDVVGLLVLSFRTKRL